MSELEQSDEIEKLKTDIILLQCDVRLLQMRLDGIRFLVDFLGLRNEDSKTNSNEDSETRAARLRKTFHVLSNKTDDFEPTGASYDRTTRTD